jgi:NADH-ubiquinone oxidoreductase chain 5
MHLTAFYKPDTHKIEDLSKATPFTTSSLTTEVKYLQVCLSWEDSTLIIESTNISYTSAWALLIILIAISLTAIYNTQIIIFPLLGQPEFLSFTNINESNHNLINVY